MEELEQFNPFEDLSDEWHLFEQAKVAYLNAEIARKDDSEIGQAIGRNYEAEAERLLGAIDGD